MSTFIQRLATLLAVAAFALAALPAVAQPAAETTPGKTAPIEATLYHNPGCQCCAAYARYLDENGFKVKVIDSSDLTSVFHQHNVPDRLASCHLMTVGKYVVVGHVPVDVVKTLLRERPDIPGISLPGMPPGSPGMGPSSGMGGSQKAPFRIVTLTSPPRVYAVR